MKFYSIKQKKPVNVPDADVTYRTTKNKRKMAVGKLGGETLYKFV
jgi:hypothetical protein